MLPAGLHRLRRLHKRATSPKPLAPHKGEIGSSSESSDREENAERNRGVVAAHGTLMRIEGPRDASWMQAT